MSRSPARDWSVAGLHPASTERSGLTSYHGAWGARPRVARHVIPGESLGSSLSIIHWGHGRRHTTPEYSRESRGHAAEACRSLGTHALVTIETRAYGRTNQNVPPSVPKFAVRIFIRSPARLPRNATMESQLCPSTSSKAAIAWQHASETTAAGDNDPTDGGRPEVAPGRNAETAGPSKEQGTKLQQANSSSSRVRNVLRKAPSTRHSTDFRQPPNFRLLLVPSIDAFKGVHFRQPLVHTRRGS